MRIVRRAVKVAPTAEVALGLAEAAAQARGIEWSEDVHIRSVGGSWVFRLGAPSYGGCIMVSVNKRTGVVGEFGARFR